MVLKISRFGKNRENREIKTAFIMYTTGGGGGGGGGEEFGWGGS